MALVVKNPPANTGDIRDAGSIPGPGRSPGEGHDNPLQYSCLENPMDREAWWTTVCGLKRVRHNWRDCACTRTCAHTHTHTLLYGFSHFLTHLSLELSSLKVHLKCSLYSLKVHWIPTLSHVVYTLFNTRNPRNVDVPFPEVSIPSNFVMITFLIFLSSTIHMCMCVLVAQSCSTRCNPMDCSRSGSSVRGIV